MKGSHLRRGLKAAVMLAVLAAATNRSGAAGISVVGSVDTPGIANAVAVSGTTAYVVDTAYYLQIIDFTNPSAPSIQSTLNGNYLDVAASGGLLFTAKNIDAFPETASGGRLDVLDISNPSSPSLLGFYDFPEEPSTFHSRLGVEGSIVYSVAGNGGYGFYLARINASNPASPVLDSSYPELPNNNSRVGIQGSRVVVGHSNFYVFDYSSPTQPLKRGVQLAPGNSAITDLVIIGPYLIVARGGGEAGGIQVFDISNPAVPTLLGAYYTQAPVLSIFATDNLIYAACDDAGVKIFDIANPSSVSLIAEGTMPGMAKSLVVVGDYVYVAAAGGGFVVMQTTDIVLNRLKNWTKYK